VSSYGSPANGVGASRNRRFALNQIRDFCCPVESKLDGKWQLIRAELAGEVAPNMVTEHVVLVLAFGDYEVRYGNEISDRGTFALDATTSQRSLILTGVEGTNAARTIPCLFQLAGDRLRVCFGLDGELPGDFTTSPDSRRYLATYRRISGCNVDRP